MNQSRILLVEDNVLTNLALREAMEAAGFQVESVHCGPTALAALRRDPPWALVTDLDLGCGPTGFDIARFARSLDPQMPVVYISGDARGRYPAEAVARSDFFAKPVTAPEILAALRPPTQVAAA